MILILFDQFVEHDCQTIKLRFVSYDLMRYYDYVFTLVNFIFQ